MFPSPLCGLLAVAALTRGRQFSLARAKLTDCNQISSVNQKKLKTEELPQRYLEARGETNCIIPENDLRKVDLPARLRLGSKRQPS
jgi:hypothetical protein